MKKRHFIALFLFLFIISVVAIFANGQLVSEASDNMNKDKIKTIAQNILNKASEKAEESVPVVADKIKEATKTIQEKGEEAMNTIIIRPSAEATKAVVKKILTSVSSSVLTDEDIREILADNKCTCR